MADEWSNAGEMEPGDLARLRAIAEEGRARPLLGGRSLIVWGAAIAAAAMFQGLVLTRALPLPYHGIGATWFALMAGAGVFAGVLRRRRTRSAPMTTANRVERAVWATTGLFLFILGLGLTLFAYLAANRLAQPWPWILLSVMAPATFGVFGIALAATAVSGHALWLRPFSWLALAFTGATAVLIGQPVQSFVMAAGAVLVGIVPGIRMTRAERDG